MNNPALCPSCNNPWTACSCYTCKKCRSSLGCSCKNFTVGAGSSANISINSSNSGVNWFVSTTCSTCQKPLAYCGCISKVIFTPAPGIGGGGGVTSGGPKCLSCGGLFGLCSCGMSVAVPAVITNFTFSPPTLEIVSDFQLFDIFSATEIETGHHFSILHRDDANGFYGKMTFIKLPVAMLDYFIKYGTPSGEAPVWQILSPLLFKMIVRDQNTHEESTHFTTLLDFTDILDQKTELFIQTPRFQEVTDNFVSLRLIARDAAYRRSLSK